MTKTTIRSTGDEQEDRDMVLCSFIDECPIPSAEEVATWRKRHPRFADAITKLAGDLLVHQAFPSPEAPEPTEAELAQWHREAVAMASSITGYTTSSITLAEMMEAASIDVPRLADAIGINRVLLADVEEGNVALPIGRKLVAALAQALAKPRDLVQDAIVNAAWSPKIAYAKASGPPSSRQVPFRQAILESDMTDERKAFWLDD